MLTRLKVSGFKNLVDIDVRFGAFTCIAGSNGVGKSNLLDAIAFLSALAEHPVSEAAMGVRNGNQRRGDLANIFHRYGDEQTRTMSFEAEMVIPKYGQDDLGQEAEATTTFVRYELELHYVERDTKENLPARIEIAKEELSYVKKGDVKKALGFRASRGWIDSAVKGIRSSFYISTSGEADNRTISMHQDGGGGGRVRKLLAKTLPRTVLSSANAVENRTATLVKNEMLSWRRVQLEPAAMRAPDTLTAPTAMGADGSHLPSMLCELARQPIYRSNGVSGIDKNGHTPSRVFSMAANRLADLIDDVRQIRVERDERLDQLTLQVAGRDGTFHPAQALSDGTLRFLALAVLELDPKFQGVIFMEEPENGIHPARIPAILKLLQDIAVDVRDPLGPGNPLRQVIINTHSPAVVAQVPEESLLIADVRRANVGEKGYAKVFFSAPEGSWRAVSGSPVFPKGKLLPYLAPVPTEAEVSWDGNDETVSEDFSRRVIDNPAYQLMLFSRDASA